MCSICFLPQTVSELILRVKPPLDNTPPSFQLPHPLLPPPPVTFSTTTTNYSFSVRDADTVMALEVQSFTGLPNRAELSEFRITGDKSGIFTYISLTHRPSSQGWAPCVLLFCCLFVHFMGWGFLGFLSPPFCLFASVLYTYNSMYILSA